jgi:hypothetical protein
LYVRTLNQNEIYLLADESRSLLDKFKFQLRRYRYKDLKLTRDTSGNFSSSIDYIASKSYFESDEMYLHAANYSPMFQLFPIEPSVESVSKENADTWENIDNYHEHRNLDEQDFEAHEISKLIVNTIKGLPKIERILELGCGGGRNISYLAKAFPNAQVIGIDINAAAKSVGLFPENTRFIQGNILEFDLESLGHFDLVLTSGFLMHINHMDVRNVITRAFEISDHLVLWELHGQSHSWDFHRYPRDYAELFESMGLEFSSYVNYAGHPVYSYELTPMFAHALLVS